jgi:hypothetical protein
LAKWRQSRLLKTIAVEEIVSVERNEAPIWMNDVHASFLYTAHVEGVGIDELHDDDAEHIFVTDMFRHKYFGQAAQEFPQAAGARTGL